MAPTLIVLLRGFRLVKWGSPYIHYYFSITPKCSQSPPETDLKVFWVQIYAFHCLDLNFGSPAIWPFGSLKSEIWSPNSEIFKNQSWPTYKKWKNHVWSLLRDVVFWKYHQRLFTSSHFSLKGGKTFTLTTLRSRIFDIGENLRWSRRRCSIALDVQAIRITHMDTADTRVLIPWFVETVGVLRPEFVPWLEKI